MDEIVRVLRIIEYTGSRARVEEVVSRSVHGTKEYGDHENKVTIRAATIGEYPEVLDPPVSGCRRLP